MLKKFRYSSSSLKYMLLSKIGSLGERQFNAIDTGDADETGHLDQDLELSLEQQIRYTLRSDYSAKF